MGSASFNGFEQERVLKEGNPIATPNVGFPHLIHELSILNEFNDFLLNVSFVSRALARVTYLRNAFKDLAAQRFRDSQSERNGI